MNTGLRQTALAGKLERFDCGAPSSGSVAVGHHIDWDTGLLLTLGRHAGVNLVNEPGLKFFAGLESATADDQRIRIKGIHHLIEEKPERMGLYPKNLPAKFIAIFRQTTNQFSRLMQVCGTRKLMTGISRQKKWQQRFFYRSERTQ